MGTGMRPPTATPTRTPGAAGRVRVPTPILHMVGEEAIRTPIAGAHRHSVAGGATQVILVAEVGVRALLVRRVGAAAEVVAAGVAEVSVEAAVASAVAKKELRKPAATAKQSTRRIYMFDLVGNRANFGARQFLLIAGSALLFSIAGCNKQSAPAEAAKTFASPDEAGKALADAAKSQSQDSILAIFGPGSVDIVSSGNPAEDKASFDGFAQAYSAMNRWRKLGDGSELLLVGTDNQAFPIPLMKNAAGQWYFDAAAGKEEILARRIGLNELHAIDVCSALADSEAQYFSQKHGGVKQYAQKFISDTGQQNGLYWESPQGSPRSPLGPLVAFATEEGITIKPDKAQPYYGYYYHRLDSQGADAKGGAKSYILDGKMTGGFAYVAYPAKYDESGVQTFIINQAGVVYQKDLGKDGADQAKAMTEFNPDKSWKPL